MLHCVRCFRVGLTSIVDGRVESESDCSDRREKTPTNIAEIICVLMNRRFRIHLNFFLPLQVVPSRRMHVKHRDQRRPIRELERNIVTDSNQHRLLHRTESRAHDNFFICGIKLQIAQLYFAERQSGQRKGTVFNFGKGRCDGGARECGNRSFPMAFQVRNRGNEFIDRLAAE